MTQQTTDRGSIRQIIRGERPRDMPFREFKIKRKAIQLFLKRRTKKSFAYISSEIKTTGKGLDKKTVRKTYSPYIKKDKRDVKK